MNHRWLKFWPQDWQRDPALRSCSAAARGVWMDMLCIMHEGKPYGHLTIGDRAASPRQIATLTGLTEKEAIKVLAELEHAGVFSRAEDGTIFSRRMVRDEIASEAGREAISKRWSKTTKVSSEPNTPPNVTPIRGGNRDPDSLEERSRYQETEAEKKEPPIPPKPSGRVAGAVAPGVFDAFWRAYPRKQDKGHAEKAFASACKSTPPEQIIAGVERAQWSPNPKYIPLPATWLNGKRWLDEVDTRDPVLIAAGYYEPKPDDTFAQFDVPTLRSIQ